MALIKCPECGKKISDKAAACIHCGCPLEHNHDNHNSQTDEITINKDAVLLPEINGENTAIEPAKSKRKFYQSNWFIFPMLLLFFPVGVFLLWKYKKTNLFVRIISTIVFAVNFLFWGLVLIALLLPCEHEWIDATCTEPKYCYICGEVEGVASGHVGGEWKLTKEATLADEGKEKNVCTVCGVTLDTREIEKKQPKIVGNTFNFTDDELIDWANSWLNDTYEIDDSGAFDLGSDILGYRVETDDGEDGMLLLKHDGGEEVSAIMVYFDDFVNRSALALFFGTKIHSSFDYDDAALILANNSTYIAAGMVVTNLTIDDDLEVALLTPESYMYKIISGTTLSPSDCYVSIENNEDFYEKYDNNMWELILNEYGEDNAQWFWIENLNDNIHDGLGVIKTYRGITLGLSTENDIIDAYGRGMKFTFNKNDDIFYRSLKAGGLDCTYLDNTRTILVYDYKSQFQIAMYIDSTGVVDCIAYFDGVWYEE